MNFNHIYSQLNPAQKEAVNNIEGPVMVIAGPGTGKTQVLSARIANILLKTDINPSSILALTFTEVAATNMRQRLFEMIGSTAYQVRIMTFHGFCNEVILSHPEYFNLREEAEPISDLEFVEFLRDYLSNPRLEYLRTSRSAFHYLNASRSALLNIKKEGLSVEDFYNLVNEEEKEFENSKEDLSKTKFDREQARIGKMKELSDLYRDYQSYLRDHSRYDYEDMILWVMEAFEKNLTLLSEYQEQLLYFLVDEYQDTNSAQNKILDQLASFWSEQANVFVVGDPNQTIYRFQGASLENVLGFVKRYPNLNLITLTQGYRCSQQIYDGAAQIIAGQKKQTTEAPDLLAILSKPLESLFQNKQIQFLQAENDVQEQITIAEKIGQLIKQGTAPEEIAVLFKTNKAALDFTEVLKKWQIDYQLERDEDILQSEFINQILLTMQVIDQIQKEDQVIDLYQLLLFEWVEVDKGLVLKLIHLAYKKKVSLYQLIKNTESEELTELKIDQAQLEQVVAYISLLEQLAVKDVQMTFLEWFPEMIQVLKIDQWLIKHHQKYQWLQELNAFYGQIKSLSVTDKKLKLSRFLEIIEAMTEQGLSIPVKVVLGNKKGVVLSTAHGAKGKEWQYVFIPHLADKVWGNARAPHQLPLPESILRFQSETKEDKNADDRRLFYVGLTRAKQTVYLSFAKQNQQKDKSQNMSMFVSQLIEKENLVEDWQTNINPENIEDLTTQFVLPSINIPSDDQFLDWLETVVAEFKLSPTALDSYLKNPEDFLFNNILRVPRAKTASLAFGTAIHATMEYTIRWWMKNGKLLSLDKIIEYFQSMLVKEVLTEEDYIARLNAGKKVLSSYFENFDFSIQPTMLEFSFGSFGREVVLDDDIKLTGKLDRVDLIDEKNKIVRVIDYKTGKVKTASRIEGKSYQNELSDREKELPDSIKGSLKRQLLFYKLLSDLDPSFAYQVQYGELDFVESLHSKGKSGKVVFELLDEDVEELKELIRQVMKEIRSLEFLKITNKEN